ncbi:MAG: nucleotidyltransferase family protein [Xanthomonadales bacterium]|nr:nucleotidyltransferase family protein [Xanthomonadales bacterium]
MTAGHDILPEAVSRGFYRLAKSGPSASLLNRLNHHGMTCLVDHWLAHARADECLGAMPDGTLRDHVAAAARDYAAQALAWRLEWQDMLRTMVDRKIEVILLKGAALAGTVYPQWHLRMLGDLDLLVHPDQAAPARSVLLDAGYSQSPALPGSLVFSQHQLRRPLSPGLLSTVDLHWALSNRNLLGGLFSWRELLDSAVPAGDLPGRRLGPEHALLHACIHRTGHHRDYERMVWLLDIHLMWQSLDHARRERVVQLAMDKGIAGLLMDALEHSEQTFDTSLGPRLRSALREAAAGESTGIFLRDRHPAIQELSTLPNWSSRARYLRQVAFPDASYMRQRYPGDSPLLLLYLRRLWNGFTRQPDRRH